MTDKPTALTLAAFLEARLSDVETIAREALDAAPDWALVAKSAAGQPAAAAGWHVLRHDPARVLAEVAAHRALIKAHWEQVTDDDPDAYIVRSNVILRHLAAIYSDHPYYDPSWAVS